MGKLDLSFSKFKNNTFIHLLFWVFIFLYYLNVSWQYESNKSFLIERIIIKLSIQISIAYCTLKFLIPYLLNRKQKLLFFIASIVLLYVSYIVFIAFRCFYLLPKYPEVYSYRPPLIFIERITDYYSFLTNLPDFIFPAAILLIINFYKKEKELATIIEHQRSNELNALRNQLNPHFLFNTLNNLYSLTLIKSDKASEIIEKLSKILDYTLYGCKSDLVPLKSEIQLLQNYIDLELFRYTDRVQVEFKHTTNQDILIAPLILLTFVENAFKHGVSQETEKASITINLSTHKNHIDFKIVNTKPKNTFRKKEIQQDSIGLQNVKRQLELLYKNKYSLDLNETKTSYSVTLKIETNDV